MWVDNYHWHYDYARLAWDTGFSFDKYKYPNLDKNKICLIDIDRIIKERDVASIDRNISTVVQYILENDQAEVLDTNFVKLFRLSQLSVEYLLFCKKYLDRTVVLLKKEVIKLKEEVKELKIYTEELETHISSSRNHPVITFKCEICSKIFSSEDYLNSHLKRRHNMEENKMGNNSEAEKLHSEIKELKERLNNTEKFIQEKPREQEMESLNFYKEEKDNDDKTTKLVGEIQHSFEKFQKQVEDKMTNLQSEKNFFTDKYDKLFEIVLQYKNKENDVTKDETKPKIENTTQTIECENKKNLGRKLQIYTVQHDCIVGDKNEKVEEKPNLQENIDEKIEKKLSNFEETIENKICTGFGNIEHQIQAFWEKLTKVESNQSKIGDHPDISQNVLQGFSQDKPKIKPRTKLTKTTHYEDENAERVKKELEAILSKKDKPEVRIESKPELKPTVVKSAVVKMYESTSEDEMSNEESSAGSLDENEAKYVESGLKLVKNDKDLPTQKSHVKSSNTKNPSDKHTFSVNKTKSSILKSNLHLKTTPVVNIHTTEKTKQKIRKNLNDLVNDSLREMGISPQWKGIPKKTFQRASEIVNHQATLNKKSHPQYDSLKKSIEKLLKNNTELKKFKQKNQPVITRDSPNRNKPKRNVIKFQIRKNQLPSPESKPKSAITIKNRSLYDTESEPDIKKYLPKNFDANKIHGDVVKELQTKFSGKKSPDVDSDLHSVESNEKNETKSALKSFVSDGGASVKKKVFFDVEDLDENEEIKDSGAGGGKNKDGDSSLSDFEISD